jgi:hypothetical protein
VRPFVAAIALVIACAACGGGDTASPEPTGTHEITGRIIGPANDAENTVDDLKDLEGHLENTYP